MAERSIYNLISVKNALIDPVTDLYLWPFNSKFMSLLVYPKIIPYTKFENFGIITFSYAADKQTNRRTRKSKILPRPTDEASTRFPRCIHSYIVRVTTRVTALMMAETICFVLVQ